LRRKTLRTGEQTVVFGDILSYRRHVQRSNQIKSSLLKTHIFEHNRSNKNSSQSV